MPTPAEHVPLGYRTAHQAVIEEADRLASTGEFGRAIDLLTDHNRVNRSFDVERALVQLRHDAYNAERTGNGVRGVVIENPPDPFADVRGRPPEVTPQELSAELLHGAITHHGCLLVRGLIGNDDVEQLRNDTVLTLASASRFVDDPNAAPDEWYEPFHPLVELDPLDRVWTRKHGTIYAADSPRVFFELVEVFRRARLDSIFQEYFGETIATSLQKCAVRRVVPSQTREVQSSMWHQDGRFLGDGVRALNVWIALSHAGVESPGMDLVPRRLPGLVPAGTDTAVMGWCVGQAEVDRAANDTPPIRPSFEPGDALIFDQLLLHSTAVSATMTEPRYSSETWFFPASNYPPDKWAPLALS